MLAEVHPAMSKPRLQINVRASEQSLARLFGLMDRMSEALGITVSQADVIQAALIELEKKYPPIPGKPSTLAQDGPSAADDAQDKGSGDRGATAKGEATSGKPA